MPEINPYEPPTETSSPPSENLEIAKKLSWRRILAIVILKILLVPTTLLAGGVAIMATCSIHSGAFRRNIIFICIIPIVVMFAVTNVFIFLIQKIRQKRIAEKS